VYCDSRVAHHSVGRDANPDPAQLCSNHHDRLDESDGFLSQRLDVFSAVSVHCSCAQYDQSKKKQARGEISKDGTGKNKSGKRTNPQLKQRCRSKEVAWGQSLRNEDHMGQIFQPDD
jgi:hypothetical protein